MPMSDRYVPNGLWALSFVIFACFVCWGFSFAASFGPDYKLTFHGLGFAVDTKFILIYAAALVPAIYCFVVYPESRSSLMRVNASWRVYSAAIVTGVSLPFLSYPGTHYYDFPFGRDEAIHLGKVFAWNLFLAPLWEEIVWRGCFLKRVRAFLPATGGILLMSVGWTLWHGGYIAYLYAAGIPVEVLRIIPLNYFCIGIILGSVFEMAQGSLWPGLLLHTSFNAATAVYYASDNRAYEVSSYISELIFMAIAAGLFLLVATRNHVPIEASA